jgi:S-methylmethionine-dependent homocysteine/selenocysteine methylase
VTGAIEAEMPVVISFTVETDGRLPSGGTLADAIEEVDAASGSAPAYYMVNCAHPTHFAEVLAERGPWQRLRGIRANASCKSHAELDEATELDRGDEAELAAQYGRLRKALPSLAVVGGCCGTDLAHVEAIAGALAGTGDAA